MGLPAHPSPSSPSSSKRDPTGPPRSPIRRGQHDHPQPRFASVRDALARCVPMEPFSVTGSAPSPIVEPQYYANIRQELRATGTRTRFGPASPGARRNPTSRNALRDMVRLSVSELRRIDRAGPERGPELSEHPARTALESVHDTPTRSAMLPIFDIHEDSNPSSQGQSAAQQHRNWFDSRAERRRRRRLQVQRAQDISLPQTASAGEEPPRPAPTEQSAPRLSTTAVDGLGDRRRSVSVDFEIDFAPASAPRADVEEHDWETLRTSIPPDVQLPTATSSFASSAESSLAAPAADTTNAQSTEQQATLQDWQDAIASVRAELPRIMRSARPGGAQEDTPRTQHSASPDGPQSATSSLALSDARTSLGPFASHASFGSSATPTSLVEVSPDVEDITEMQVEGRVICDDARDTIPPFARSRRPSRAPSSGGPSSRAPSESLGVPNTSYASSGLPRRRYAPYSRPPPRPSTIELVNPRATPFPPSMSNSQRLRDSDPERIRAMVLAEEHGIPTLPASLIESHRRQRDRGVALLAARPTLTPTEAVRHWGQEVRQGIRPTEQPEAEDDSEQRAIIRRRRARRRLWQERMAEDATHSHAITHIYTEEVSTAGLGLPTTDWSEDELSSRLSEFSGGGSNDYSTDFVPEGLEEEDWTTFDPHEAAQARVRELIRSRRLSTNRAHLRSPSPRTRGAPFESILGMPEGTTTTTTEEARASGLAVARPGTPRPGTERRGAETAATSSAPTNPAPPASVPPPSTSAPLPPTGVYYSSGAARIAAQAATYVRTLSATDRQAVMRHHNVSASDVRRDPTALHRRIAARNDSLLLSIAQRGARPAGGDFTAQERHEILRLLSRLDRSNGLVYRPVRRPTLLLRPTPTLRPGSELGDAASWPDGAGPVLELGLRGADGPARDGGDRLGGTASAAVSTAVPATVPATVPAMVPTPASTTASAAVSATHRPPPVVGSGAGLRPADRGNSLEQLRDQVGGAGVGGLGGPAVVAALYSRPMPVSEQHDQLRRIGELLRCGREVPGWLWQVAGLAPELGGAFDV